MGPWADDELVAHLRRILEASPFPGESYRKVWARLRPTPLAMRYTWRWHRIIIAAFFFPGMMHILQTPTHLSIFDMSTPSWVCMSL